MESYKSERGAVAADPVGGLAGLILIAFIVIVIGAWLISAGVLSLDSIPLTQHAQQEREGTSLSAATIKALMTSGKCSPIRAYKCPDHFKVICRMKGGLWAGLIIGLEGGQVIVTGYPGTETYWMNSVQRDGCIESAIPVIP